VSGVASVAGILNVSLVNGFRPNVGDTFRIIASNGETGNFTTINSSGFTVRSDVSPSGVVLTVTAVTLPPPVVLTSLVSRKTHGGSTVLDLPLPLSGNVGVESRAGGTTIEHLLIFTFATPLASTGGATITAGTGIVYGEGIGSDPHQYIVSLTGVNNAQKLTVSLTNVSDTSGNYSPAVVTSVGFLLGDANGDGTVNSADVTFVRNHSGQFADGTNLSADFNLDGAVNSADVITARAQSGNSIPLGAGVVTDGMR
ncbi:MAG: dockerin type I repeat-containing protein, partial [Verrucomicrobiota bacterium]|nr:dockerin type I repeat-containing protein [Verrucomicrobiota bacterium]